MPFGWAPRALWFRVGLYNTRCPDGGHRAEMVIRPLRIWLVRRALWFRVGYKVVT